MIAEGTLKNIKENKEDYGEEGVITKGQSGRVKEVSADYKAESEDSKL